MANQSQTVIIFFSFMRNGKKRYWYTLQDWKDLFRESESDNDDEFKGF